MHFVYSFNWEFQTASFLSEIPSLCHFLSLCQDLLGSPNYFSVCTLISHPGHSAAFFHGGSQTTAKIRNSPCALPLLHLVFNCTEHIERLKETLLFWLFICCRMHMKRWSLPSNSSQSCAAAGTVQSNYGIIYISHFVNFYLFGQYLKKNRDGGFSEEA